MANFQAAPDYRERFADKLGKELPRIPCVKNAADFRAFSTAGRELAKLHLNYDWAVETMRNPRFPLELLLRVITVSLETMKIVKGLPRLNI